MGRYSEGMKDDYHHGDLRRALLEAAEAELSENGFEGFSLRKVAKRAGVSHAAPAHHFQDVRGLLTALTTQGYERFVAAQQARQDGATDDPRDQLMAMGLGYIDFALANTALFRLMFSSERPNFEDPVLADAANAAFTKLADGIAEVVGQHPYQDNDAMEQAGALWAMAHGLSDLVSSGRMGYVTCLPHSAKEKVFRTILAQALP